MDVDGQTSSSAAAEAKAADLAAKATLASAAAAAASAAAASLPQRGPSSTAWPTVNMFCLPSDAEQAQFMVGELYSLLFPIMAEIIRMPFPYPGMVVSYLSPSSVCP